MTTQQNTGFTLSDSLALIWPFLPQEHEFNRGFIYIEEAAICRRIEKIDLNWEWKIVEMLPAENGNVTVVGALTIKGITRYGTGQQVIQFDKNERETVGEARKGATTDALKRAARLFGIGRYLLQCPSSVKGYGPELEKWLAEIKKQQSKDVPDAAPQQAAPAPSKSEPVAIAPKPPVWWPVLKEYKPFMSDTDFSMMRDALSDGVKQGTITFGDEHGARGHIERAYGLFIDLDTKRAADKEAS
jgi:hypothetical protein